MDGPQQDPHNTVVPDFMAPEFAAQCQFLTDGDVPDAQAAVILTNIWNENNARDRAAWLQHQAEQELAQHEHEQAVEIEAQRHRQEADLLEAAHLEECRKNKAKYNPICDDPVPSGLIIILFATAQAKMKKGTYCNLWYFTNHGLKVAEKSAASQENLDYVAVCQDEDDAQVLVVAPASDLPASKPCGKKEEVPKLIADEDLSWEDFLKATPCIIVSMRDNEWAKDQIQMFVNFWTAIHGHPWCHAMDRFSQWALLVYQAQQQRKWHLAAGTAHNWSLARINQEVLQEAKDVIITEAHKCELIALREVSVSSHCPPCSLSPCPPLFSGRLLGLTAHLGALACHTMLAASEQIS